MAAQARACAASLFERRFVEDGILGPAVAAAIIVATLVAILGLS
jgi:hypothetical protein